MGKVNAKVMIATVTGGGSCFSWPSSRPLIFRLNEFSNCGQSYVLLSWRGEIEYIFISSYDEGHRDLHNAF